MGRPRTPSSDRVLLLALCESQLRSVKDLQALIVGEVLASEGPVPLQLAEFLEDVANALLDASEAISARHLEARREAPSSPSGTASACRAAG